jgi:hypothetical protein
MFHSGAEASVFGFLSSRVCGSALLRLGKSFVEVSKASITFTLTDYYYFRPLARYGARHSFGSDWKIEKTLLLAGWVGGRFATFSVESINKQRWGA